MLMLFTDGSVSPKLGVGFGAYLAVQDVPEDLSELNQLVKVKRFENTSSTKLELETLLWALSEVDKERVISYTDSQNLTGLLSRKEKLESNNYCSRGGRRIRNHEIYKVFFEKAAEMDLTIHQVSGHKPSNKKMAMDKIFTIVDRASRNALRAYLDNRFQRGAGGDRTH